MSAAYTALSSLEFSINMWLQLTIKELGIDYTSILHTYIHTVQVINSIYTILLYINGLVSMHMPTDLAHRLTIYIYIYIYVALTQYMLDPCARHLVVRSILALS